MRKIVTVLLIIFSLQVKGSKISEAYKALSIYDYFKAKELFYKCYIKNKSEAAYGLSHIYYRNDNPFSNIDSAAKYIAITQTAYTDTVTYFGYHISKTNIEQLASKIGEKGFLLYAQKNSTDSLNHFLKRFFFADSLLLNKTFLKRDSIALSYYSLFELSDSITVFIQKFPLSRLKNKAQVLLYDYEYATNTNLKSIAQYQNFIKSYQKNPHIFDAETNLFSLIQKLHLPDSIYNFIKKYSTSLTKENAWKLLYSISVKLYNKEELSAFMEKYPDYPFHETIAKEILMAQSILLPLKNSDEKYGYIDTTGKWVIAPQYDDAMKFSEGFAGVCKNDTCFYINKEGKKISENYFEEVENYKNGVAITKKENTYYLINRSGQFISQGYQDISTVHGKIFICKLNNKYGAINAKGENIIPFIYNKLGNFKNNFAYYMSVKYGLVDVNNNALEAKWDWVSDVDTNTIAIVKKDNFFGLLSVNEELVLPAEYDYAAQCANEIYIVVKKNLYGFYNVKQKCFITGVDYNYISIYEPSYYSNGKYFKLLKDNEVALIDANGKYSINFGTYSDLFFAKNDIIRIQKNNKFGFVDRKLRPITGVEFEKAEDFKNKVAIVSKKGNSLMIDTEGKIIYTLKGGIIENSSLTNLFKTELNDMMGLINTQGEVLLDNIYDSIDSVTDYLYVCKKKEAIFIYNTITKTLNKL